MTLERLNELMEKNGWAMTCSIPQIGKVGYTKGDSHVWVERDYRDIVLSCGRVRTEPTYLMDASITTYNEIAVYIGLTKAGRIQL